MSFLDVSWTEPGWGAALGLSPSIHGTLRRPSLRLILASRLCLTPLGHSAAEAVRVWVRPMHAYNSLFDSCVSHSAIGLAYATVPNLSELPPGSGRELGSGFGPCMPCQRGVWLATTPHLLCGLGAVEGPQWLPGPSHLVLGAAASTQWICCCTARRALGTGVKGRPLIETPPW